MSDPAVKRRTLLTPSRHAPPRRHRAVPAPARQAAVDAPVPAYVHGTAALGTAAEEDSRAGRPSTVAQSSTQPSQHGHSPFFAAVVQLQERHSADPAAQSVWQPVSARVGRYFGGAPSADAVPAEQRAGTTTGAAVQLAVEEVTRGNEAEPDADTRLGLDGRNDDDATITRLRVGISKSGDSGLLCWRLLLELLARRAATTPSPGAIARATSLGCNCFRCMPCRVQHRHVGKRRPHSRGPGRGSTGGRRSARLLSGLDRSAGRPVALAGARRVAAASSAGGHSTSREWCVEHKLHSELDRLISRLMSSSRH